MVRGSAIPRFEVERGPNFGIHRIDMRIGEGLSESGLSEEHGSPGFSTVTSRAWFLFSSSISASASPSAFSNACLLNLINFRMSPEPRNH